MKFAKIPARAEYLIEFFEEGLHSLGAVCERSWYDSLEVLAEGVAARLWRTEGDLFSGQLYFREGRSGGASDPESAVFPGCPLVFRLIEALWQEHLAHCRAYLCADGSSKAPSNEVAFKLWNAQFGSCSRWRATPFVPTWQFSLVAAVRCEIQAIDQSWSSHRLAFSLPGGERDSSLESVLEQSSPIEPVGERPDWPALDSATVSDWIGRALCAEIALELARIKERQQLFLRRELNRIDEYFENYSRELSERKDRQHKQEATKRYADRLDATRFEHQRRRVDQIERHTIRLVPHVDALLTVAEPAFATCVTRRSGREEQIVPAVFVPRTRQWYLRKTGF